MYLCAYTCMLTHTYMYLQHIRTYEHIESHRIQRMCIITLHEPMSLNKISKNKMNYVLVTLHILQIPHKQFGPSHDFKSFLKVDNSTHRFRSEGN